MDFIGDIVEHSEEPPTIPTLLDDVSTGFPVMKKSLSRFRSSQGKSSQAKSSQAKSNQATGLTGVLAESDVISGDLYRALSRALSRTLPKAQSSGGLSEGSRVQSSQTGGLAGLAGLAEGEAAKIHAENMAKISGLSPEEFIREKEELLEGLDPALLQGLLKRSENKSKLHKHAEGYHGWIGGGRDGHELPHLSDEDVNKALGIKSVAFADDIQEIEASEAPASEAEPKVCEDLKTKSSDLDSVDLKAKNSGLGSDDLKSKNSGLGSDDFEAPAEASADASASAPDALSSIAPPDYQIISEEPLGVHFPRPKIPREDPNLDINDPHFLDRLHEKYYPDLPKETSKLQWMKDPGPQPKSSSYSAISEMRFDFKGNLVDPESTDEENPATHLGLHHHAADQHMPGYTLPELAHLARSMVPTQRCISLQTLGRILHKLGLRKYNIAPLPTEDSDNKAFNAQARDLSLRFDAMMWDLVDSLRIIDTITEAADEKITRNLSVRTYALEALWLWKQGGGRPPEAVSKSEEEILAEMS